MASYERTMGRMFAALAVLLAAAVLVGGCAVRYEASDARVVLSAAG